MGAVSPLGCGVGTNWSRLLAGRSGIRTLPEAITADLSAKVGGQVPDVAVDPEGGFDPDRVSPRKDQRKMDRFILFALLAADEAIAQANWKPEDVRSRQRTATVIASGIGGFPAIADAVRTTDIKGIRRLSPFTVPSFLVNLAAGHISIRYGFEGAIGAPVTACAASVQAIGDAARLIRAGEADIAICGGAEACIDRVSLGGFAAARTFVGLQRHAGARVAAVRPRPRRIRNGRRRRRRSDRGARSRAGAGCGADRRSDRLRHHIGRVSHDRRARRRGWR
jgi:3-oxoacyl-[acyl-carrier-protein] synthase II